MFDAVLLIAFGGPLGRDDIRPFLANVLRGRPVTPERVEDVVHHYELFDGVSPLAAITARQAEGLRARLATAEVPLPVYVGMRNWHPLLVDTLAAMARDGVRRAIGFILAAQGSYSSCQQYKENVLDARKTVVDEGGRGVEITYAGGWHTHDLFVEANARHVRAAINSLPEQARTRARLIFTAHSIPVRLAARSRYQQQLLESSAAVAARAGCTDWTLVYQSRSGRPEDPWLGPDIGDYLRTTRDEGLDAAVVCPIGFVCDHIEVLYDLDREAASIARGLGLTLARAATVNDDPLFLDMMADVISAAVRRHVRGRALELAVQRASR